MPLPGSAPLRRALLGFAGALAVAAAAAPSAQADFTMPFCGGGNVAGRGSTFQANAFAGFRTIFAKADPQGCSQTVDHLVVDYNKSGLTGSGAGLAALGAQNATNPNGDRDLSVRFAGTDIPPSPAQRQQIERGLVDPTTRQDVTAADNGKLHVIPISMGAITILVHLPNNCDYSGATLVRNRPTTTNAKIEQAFAGEIATWGGLFTGLDATCAAQPLNRVVRKDDSGTTFALKQFLQRANPARTPAWNTYDNTKWPGAAPTYADSDGGGGLRTKLDTTTGIGYLALSDARGGGGIFTWEAATDTKFWLPIQHQNGATFDDPQLSTDGYKFNDPGRGANCVNAQPHDPLPASSLGDWSGVDYTYTDVASTYGICTLTYDLAFDDNAVVYCNNSDEEKSARTLKDFFTRAVVTQAGQATLPPNDYDKLPTDALVKAVDAVNTIGWNKGGQGRPCTPDSNPNPNPNPNPGGGGGQNPPAKISNAFTIASSRVSGTAIRLSLQLPGAGSVKIAWSTKPKKGKAITLAAKTVKITKSGAQAISLSLSSKAKKALKKDKKLKVTLKITYTPTGGTAKTTTKTVTVKQPKKG